MASVLPLATTSAPPAPVGLEEQLQRLENVLPSLVNDCAVMVHRPFRIEWDWFSPTASTDCRSVINLSPWFFIRGDEISPAGMPLQEVGFGSAYHECGHIRHSP